MMPEGIQIRKNMNLAKLTKCLGVLFLTTWVSSHALAAVIVTLQAIKQGQDYWATISADAAPGKANAQRQARAIDSRASGWAYKLPPYKGQQIMTTLDSLLKPPPEKSATPAK